MNSENNKSLEAEYAVIGSMLIDPRCVPPVLAKAELSDFRSDSCRTLFSAIRALYQAGAPVDAVTVRDKVGSEYGEMIVDLMAITPTAANVMEYVKIAHEDALLASIRKAADELNYSTSLDDCRGPAERISAILSDRPELPAWSMADAMTAFLASQTEDGRKRRQYIRLGLSEIDDGSFIEPGDVAVLAGWPSDGKTALALQWAVNVASERKVGFFSLETKPEKLTDRLVSNFFGVSFTAIKRGTVSPETIARIGNDYNRLIGHNLTLIHAPGMSVGQIAAISKGYGFEAIVIDYAQLIPPVTRSVNRSEQMAEVSRELHQFAQSSGTFVIELLQLARPQKSAGWTEPTMQDLKESGQWEQDADEVFLLYRPGPKDGADANKTRWLKIAKNKEGHTGKGMLTFDGDLQRFRLATPGDVGNVQAHYAEIGRDAKRRNLNVAQMQFTEMPDAEIPAERRTSCRSEIGSM